MIDNFGVSMETLNLVADYSFIDTPEDYAEAAVSRNPNLRWTKFVFTDNLANANRKRIPESEFANVINTGYNMPIKMQSANPDGVHELSRPIGVITNLAKQDNKIIGLAALWMKEFPEDVAMLEAAYAEKKPLKLSWEVFYEKAEADESGIEDLKGVTVRATTFVGNPAYQGRTNVVAMAEVLQSTQEEITLAEKTITDLEAQIAELTNKLNDVTSQLASANEAAEATNSELNTLREYKTQREAADAKDTLLSSRRNTLVEAGIKVTDEWFAERVERIANMDEDTFGFFTQELVAFSARTPEATSEVRNTSIPNVTTTDTKDPSAILRAAIKK
jgi:FtsZ-binding cell division protein ZapB